MRVTRLFAGSPAPVAPLPPQVSPRSVTFSMAKSATFSMAIDTRRGEAGLPGRVVGGQLSGRMGTRFPEAAPALRRAASGAEAHGV